ncbi:PP2C family protein-serine/threonine phosphatase [Pleionea mediterranea]|uniref:Protein phosphatase n=1 Tax=Pleionea mediterranea TaxID=523701 RepID=A0A316FSV1_9GAMM|nr:protein phosphatase 2C domain-containing protein [Pleionea mediterranea]PWK51838.1 protein phosphatase [Pleionea mediterranea]
MEQNQSLNWQYVCRTDPGKVRELNEDSCLCEPELGLWVVADGMGGHSCGEVASHQAIESIKQECAAGKSVSEAIQQAHFDILKAAESGEGADGMGTTAVALKHNGSGFSMNWVGDSRGYLWQPKKKRLTQLTQDHSLVERLLSAGLISQEESKSHPQRHLITQCLGSKELKQVKVDTTRYQWEPEQVILLCSDGLTEELTEQDMITIFSAQSDLDITADRLLRMALNKGGQDNISIILLRSPIELPKGLKGLWYRLSLMARKLKIIK